MNLRRQLSGGSRQGMMVSLFTRRTRLDDGLRESNMLDSYNRLVQQENVCMHNAAGCQAAVVQRVVQTAAFCMQASNRSYNRLCCVNTILKVCYLCLLKSRHCMVTESSET